MPLIDLFRNRNIKIGFSLRKIKTVFDDFQIKFACFECIKVSTTLSNLPAFSFKFIMLYIYLKIIPKNPFASATKKIVEINVEIRAIKYLFLDSEKRYLTVNAKKIGPPITLIKIHIIIFPKCLNLSRYFFSFPFSSFSKFIMK